MIARIGLFKEYVPPSAGWWDVSSATCLCAYQAKGAANAAASYLDLTGNGYTLTGASPTWDVNQGWTSYAIFDTISGLTMPTTASVIWAGKSQSTQTAWFCGSSDGINMFLYDYATPRIQAKFGSPATLIGEFPDNSVEKVFIYTKNVSTGAQEVFIDGVSADSDLSGGTPTDLDAILYTSEDANLKAAAIYSGVLSQADITAISTYLNNL